MKISLILRRLRAVLAVSLSGILPLLDHLLEVARARQRLLLAFVHDLREAGRLRCIELGEDLRRLFISL